MGVLSPILRSVAPNMVGFWCPGCDEPHVIPVKIGPKEPGSWEWDGNVKKPTFSPSLLVQGTRPITDDEAARIMAGETIKPEATRCHSFVRAGQIEFLGDCLHALKGQTIPIPPWPSGYDE